MNQLRTPLVIVVALSFALGLGWGVRLVRHHQAAEGRLRDLPTVRILSVPGVLSPGLIQAFQTETQKQLTLKYDPKLVVELAKNTTELIQKLEQSQVHYDLVLYMSYQFEELLRRGLLRRLDPKTANWESLVSADFVALPDNRAREYLIPLLWGVSGMAIHSSDWTKLPNSWRDAIARTSPDEIRLGDNQTFLSAAMPVDENDADSLSAVQMNQGEMAFKPFSEKPWTFTFPDEKGFFWLLGAGIPREANALDASETLLRFLLRVSTARKLVEETHQASTLKEIEATDLDARLKPSYLRQIPLTRYIVMHDLLPEINLRAIATEK